MGPAACVVGYPPLRSGRDASMVTSRHKNATELVTPGFERREARHPAGSYERTTMSLLPDVPDLIRGELVELRAPDVEHTDAVVEAVRESLAELKVWMPWATDDYDREGAELSLRRAVAAFVTREDLRYHMFEPVTGRLLGSTGLHRIKWSVPRFEIGYWLRSSATGRGYTTDAVRALTRTAFERLGARRVEIRCDDGNVRSAAVAERCGFALEGVLRNYTVGTDGTVRDERVYALTELTGLR